MGYSSAEAKAFIKEIAPYAQKAYRELGKVLPSICIGMAMVESAAGTSKIMRQHNAFLGQKVGSGKTATKYWGGKFYVAKTKEEYTVGTHTVIRDAFRSFDTIEQCVFNYYELLNSSVYKNVSSGVDYKTQMAQIKACGYMTSSTEVNSVISLIQKYDLTQYDNGAPNVADLQTSTDKIPIEYYPLLKIGSSGVWVVYLQEKLNSHGYLLKVDGKFGPNTQMAVIQFQGLRGLVKDGKVGRKTWEKLEM